MLRLRKEDTSLYLYIKDIALKPYIEFQEQEGLIYNSILSSSASKVYSINSLATPNPFEAGRGVVYFDDNFDQTLVNCTTYSGSMEQSNRVIVYDELGIVIPDSDYIVDYIDGRIITSSNVNPTTVDFYWNYASVVDEWPDGAAAVAPVVVIDIGGTDKKGYQLGAGKLINRKCSLHIFASSAAERNDLSELLYDSLYLKSCPIYELPRGSVLDFDGTFVGRKMSNDKSTNLFSRETVSGTGNLLFDNVSARNITLPLTLPKGANDVILSSLNAYRARITFDLVSYTEA